MADDETKPDPEAAAAEASPETAADETPEKPPFPNVTPALRRRLKTCHEHAQALMSAGRGEYDFDYANSLLSTCVTADPSRLEYVEGFLDNLERKFKEGRGKAGGGGGFGGWGGNPLEAKLEAGDFAEVFKEGVDALGENPWDVPTLRALAKGCRMLGFNESELRFLKTAFSAAPKNIDVNRHCAQSLARMGQFDQAIACWHRIEEIDRKNEEAQKAIGQLTLIKARSSAGLELDAQMMSEVTGEPVAVIRRQLAEEAEQAEGDGPAVDGPEAEQRPKREIKLTPRQELQRQCDANPHDVPSHHRLAELLLEEQRPQEAVQILEKALVAEPENAETQRRLDDARIMRQRSLIALIEKQAERDRGGESRERLEREKTALRELERSVAEQRFDEEESPQNRLALARTLQRCDETDAALEHFEQLLADPEHGPTAALGKAECLQNSKQYAAALKQYVEAAKAAPAKSELQKKSLYRAGVLAMGMKNGDAARKILRKLSGIDANYRDVAERLDKLG